MDPQALPHLDFSNMQLAEYGFAGLFLILLVLLWRWTSTKIDKILDNSREDLNNTRREYLETIKSLTDTFREEVKEVRQICRQDQEQHREILSKISETLIRHEVALEKLLDYHPSSK